MIHMLPRLLKITLPKGQSAFLWGPRKTGKTTFLREAFPDSLSYDLLQTDLFLEFVKRPRKRKGDVLSETT
jgi:predicted AAA+ superfamily ATPase